LEIEEESVCRREEVDVVMLSSSVGERVSFSRALDVERVVRWCGLFLLLLVVLEWAEMLRYDGRILCRYDRSEVMCVFYREVRRFVSSIVRVDCLFEEYGEDERCGTLL